MGQAEPDRLSAKPSRCCSERIELGRHSGRVNRHDGVFHRMPIRSTGT
ncbi:hypothetical protein [Azospirillum largimobile]